MSAFLFSARISMAVEAPSRVFLCELQNVDLLRMFLACLGLCWFYFNVFSKSFDSSTLLVLRLPIPLWYIPACVLFNILTGQFFTQMTPIFPNFEIVLCRWT